MVKLTVDQALLKADSHARKGEIEEAQKLFAEILQAFPKNKRAQQGLAALNEPKQSTAKQGPPQDTINQLVNLYNQGQFGAVVEQAKNLMVQYPGAFIVWNILGAAAAQTGQIDQAIYAFKRVVEIKPDYADAYNNMGATLQEQGKFDEAIESYQKALSLKPDYAEAYNNMGTVLQEQGKLDEAIEAYTKAMSMKPDFADAYNNMGNAFKAQATLDEAIASYHKALSLKPDFADAYNNMGLTLQEQGKLDEAIASYNNALSLKPGYANASYNMGNALKDQGKLDEAVVFYNQAVSLKPDYADAYNNMGNAFKAQAKLDEAIASYHKALSLKPDYADAYNNMGAALQEQGKLDEAKEAYIKALSLKPDYAEAYNNMGTALQEHGKLDEAIEAYTKALSMKPDFAEVHNNMGNTFKGKDRLEEAIASYKQALATKPDYTVAYHNMGLTLQEQDKLDEAIASYNNALSLKPDYAPARAQKLHQQARICDWDKVTDELPFLANLGVEGAGVPPFTLLALEDNPYRHRLRSENYAKKKFLQNAITDFVIPNKKPKRLRIGYFSADFKEHPVAQLMAKVIETHDRECFEIYGYSIGPVTHDKMRQRLINGFDVFHDLNDMTSQDMALLARHDKIDIAVDLTGYMQNNRSEIFAFRAAPIQINYLGYPGTMGSDLFDYIIADQNLIPNESQKYYAEKPIYLPHHYQAQDDKLHISDVTPSKSELGLPEDSFVFCAINNTYKITPSEFNIWMRLLQNLDGSVLWLLERNKWVKANLIKEAHKRGIPSERLVFAQRVPHDKYLAQFRQADLYLDTFKYNAGATASNALWAGLPVLTKLGKGYTARMAGSLLSAIGLPELITNNETEYEKLALELATNPEKLSSIKQKLAINRLSKPLFNTELFTKHLEDGYQRAYQRYFEGKKAATIYVPE